MPSLPLSRMQKALVITTTLAPVMIGMSTAAAAPVTPHRISAATSCNKGDIQYWDNRHQFGYSLGGACQYSPDGKHKMIFQDDGNFVLYHVYIGSSVHTWSSDTQHTGYSLQFGYNGAMYIVNSNGNAVWSNNINFNSGSTNYYEAVMQDDGNFVEYHRTSTGAAWTAVWATNTKGR